MLTTIYLGIAILFSIGIALVLNLNVKTVSEDIMEFIRPQDNIKNRAKTARKENKTGGLYHKIIAIKLAMEATGNGAKFAIVVVSAVAAVAVSAFFCIQIDNLYLTPVLCCAAAVFPFAIANGTANRYEQKVKDELEIAMSLITNSYLRRDDLPGSVKENLIYIKKPLRNAFSSFVGETTAISSNTKRALLRLRDTVDDAIFREWVDALISCQDNRAMKGTLLPIIAKISELRLINNDMKTAIYSARMEYFTMVVLCFVNIPLLWLLNKEWLDTLLFTTQGKICYTICLAVIFVTMLLMFKFTKPVEYKR